MTLTAVGTNTITGSRGDNVISLPITDSTTLTANDFLELSSGKLIKSVTTLSSSLVGVANTTQTMGVYSTTGMQLYCGVITEGLVIVKGLVEGSGGTYTTALAVGDKVSFHYDSTAGYGQFAVNSTAAPIGVVVEGTVASSGSTTDYWDYVLIQLNFEVGLSGIGDIPSTIGKDITIATDNNLYFRDTGIYIQSSADGKLLISSDGSGADNITLTGNVTITNDLLVGGTFSGLSAGGTFTGTVQINDNATLQFEGVSATANGLAIDCDASGDATFLCAAGLIDFSTKDGIVRFADSDVGTDYVDIITGSGSSWVIFAGEPDGKFRFKDLGDANNSDVLDFTLTDAGAANVINSAVGLTISTTAGDLTLDPAGNDIVFGTSAGKITVAATSTSIYGGDTTTDDLKLYSNSADANPVVTLNGLGAVDVLVNDQLFTVSRNGSNYLKTSVSAAGAVVMTTIGSSDSFQLVTEDGNITLTSAGDIALQATGADITMNAQLTLLSTTANQVEIQYTAAEYFRINVDSDGSTTLETVSAGAVADIDIKTDTGGGDIKLTAATDLDFIPGVNINYTIPAAGIITYDAGTTDHTGANVILMNADINSASCDVIGLDVDVGTALSAAETVNGIKIDIDGNALDDVASFVNAFYLTSAGTSGGTTTGINYAGTWDVGFDLSSATTTTDIVLSNGGTIHNTSAAIMTLTEATVAIAGDITVSGHRDSHIMMYNNFNQGVTGTVSTLDDGTAFVDQGQTAATIIFPVSALKVGDELVGFRVVGALGGTGGNATTVDADLRKVTKGAGAVTDASVGAITQASVTADTALDSAKTFGAVETVASDYQYYVLVTITTANNAANDAAITGIEVDINRKV